MLVWPGILTWDSEDQYAQALSGQYANWHPPVMAALWRLLLPVAPVGGSLLLVHLTLYWAALLVIAATLARISRPRWGYAVLASGLLPNLLLVSAFIHKDVGLATSLLVAFAILFAYRARDLAVPWYAAIAAGVLLAYATLVRSNAVFAIGPVLAYAFAPRALAKPVRLIIASAVITVLAVPASNVVNLRILGAADDGPQRSLIFFDLTGIAHRARDADVFGRAVNPPLALIDRCYRPELWDPLKDKRPCKAGIGNEWISGGRLVRAIARHPFAYAMHRLAHWNATLSFWSPVDRWNWYDNPRFNIPPARHEAQIMAALQAVSNFPLFSPALAVAMAAALLGIIVGFRQQLSGPATQAAYYLAATTCFYAGSFLLVGVASMYRYQQLTFSGGVIALLLYLAGHTERPADRNRTATRWLVMTGATVLAITSIARLTLPSVPLN